MTADSLEVHRKELTAHCYRMLGSAVDADDAVQETMLRAWRSIGAFEGRSAVRTWLYRIATNVCLDQLSSRPERKRPMSTGTQGTVDDPLVEQPQNQWLEPVPDALVIDAAHDPERRVIEQQRIRLAFVAALQLLPPRQRAALLLADVAEWSAAEIAATLDTSTASVNSALQRARATLASHRETPPRPQEVDQAVLDRFLDAFHRYDVDALTSLLREDVVFSMPPFSLWLRGRESVAAWLLGRGAGCSQSRLVPTRANGLPAFGQYHRCAGGGYHPWALAVLEMEEGEIVGWNSFLDTKTLFPLFDLPDHLDE